MPICNDTLYIHVCSIIIVVPILYVWTAHWVRSLNPVPPDHTTFVHSQNCIAVVSNQTCWSCRVCRVQLHSHHVFPLSSPRRCHLHSKRAVHTKPTRSSAKFRLLYFTQEGTRQQRQPLLQQLQQAGCECEIERAACLLELEDAFPQEVEVSWTEKDLGWERKSFDPWEPRICPICSGLEGPSASGVYVHANTCAKLIVRQKKLTLLVAVRSETKSAPDPKIVSG